MSRPNPEQDAIVEASKSRRSLSCAAGAGTGKTTTMVKVAEANPYTKILYLAYNASTKEEGKRRFPSNTRVMTSHGLAYGAIGKEYGHRLNARKVQSRRAAQIMGLPQEIRFAYCLQCREEVAGLGHEGHPVTAERLESWRVASLVKRTMERFCYSAERKVLRSHAPKVQGLDERVLPQVQRYVSGLAQEWWSKDVTSLDGQLWFWPDVYLKLYQLQQPRLFQRLLILDEAQDTNECVWDIFQQQQGKQIILVGDSNQMIYEWRGARDVMNDLDGAQRLQLTGSYRFGPAVAEEANRWLELLGSDLRLRGYRRLDSIVTDEPQDEEPDAVICRTNAGCIAGAMQGLEAGKTVAIVGGGNAIEWLAQAAQDLMDGRTTDHPELIGFEKWADVQRYVKEEPEDAGSLVPIVNAVDAYGPQAILDMTRRLVPEDRAELAVTTCHKAKGREWSHIRIGDDFPQPLPGKQPRTEELRLAYVAVTRGKLVVERGSLDWIGAL